MKLEISNRKKFGKLTNMLKFNKTILKKSTGQKRYSKENEKEFDKNENEDTYTKTYESHYCLMEIHSYKRLH